MYVHTYIRQFHSVTANFKFKEIYLQLTAKHKFTDEGFLLHASGAV